jgi:hypothetical protein
MSHALFPTHIGWNTKAIGAHAERRLSHWPNGWGVCIASVTDGGQGRREDDLQKSRDASARCTHYSPSTLARTLLTGARAERRLSRWPHAQLRCVEHLNHRMGGEFALRVSLTAGKEGKMVVVVSKKSKISRPHTFTIIGNTPYILRCDHATLRRMQRRRIEVIRARMR